MKRKLAVREKITVILAVAVLVGGVYAMTRVKAREAESALMIEEVARLQAEIANTKPAAASNDAASAEEELASARAQLEDVKKQVESLDLYQGDVTSGDAVQVAMMNIAKLASQYQVKLKSAESTAAGVPGLGEFASGNDPLKDRPLRQLALSGTFFNMSAFLDSLTKGSYAVTIMRFALEAPAMPASTQPPLLDAEVVILL